MIPVSVGQGILKSQQAIVRHEIESERRKHMRCHHQIGSKNWLERLLLGIKF